MRAGKLVDLRQWNEFKVWWCVSGEDAFDDVIMTIRSPIEFLKELQECFPINLKKVNKVCKAMNEIETLLGQLRLSSTSRSNKALSNRQSIYVYIRVRLLRIMDYVLDRLQTMSIRININALERDSSEYKEFEKYFDDKYLSYKMDILDLCKAVYLNAKGRYISIPLDDWDTYVKESIQEKTEELRDFDYSRAE